MKQKRIVQIDIMKLLCALFVVMIHIVTDYRVQQGIISKNILLAESFLRCCVPVFFMCSGYFLFIKDNSVKKTYKKMIRSLVIPTLAVVLFWYIFNNVVENQNTIIECIKNIQIESFGQLLKGIINWDLSGVKNGFYLWFMISLIKIYIAYPVLKLVCVDEPKASKIRKYCLGLGMLSEMIFPTIESFSHNTVSIYGYSIWGDYSFVYVLIGYELYLIFSITDTKLKGSIYGFAVYISGAMITYLGTVYVDVKFDGSFKGWFFEYNQIGVFISAVGFFYFIINLNIRNENICNIISFLAQRTFAVYLVHYIVVRGFTCYGIMEFWRETMPRPIFYIFSSIICYLCSFGIAIVLYTVCEMFRRRGGNKF